jgi:2,3-bisphosphoglycerate-independent phosphoglycerate mutase
MADGLKILLVVIDGLGDRPYGAKTPLQAARKPLLDRLAAEGINGQCDTVAPGVRPGSAPGHLALLGYDPYTFYYGRGPFEAAGTGIKLKPGEVAWRCNFATVKGGKVVDRRAGRIRETKALERAIREEVDPGVPFEFRAGTGHRGALVFRGPGLGSEVSPTDPKKEGKPVAEARPLAPAAKRTADALNRFTKQAMEVLSGHPLNRRRVESGLPPANALLCRSPGSVPEIPPFASRTQMKGAAIAATALIRGVAGLCGLKFIPVPGVTGGVDSPIERKMAAANRALKSHDFVLMNLKGADEAGHDRNWEAKKRYLSRVSEAMGGLDLRDDLVLAVTGDHSTPCKLGDHTGDPVPILIHGAPVRPDGVKRFDEVSCASGGLGRIRGVEVLPVLLDLAGRNEKFGE